MKIKNTRISYLGYAMIEAGLWRVIDKSDGRNAVVGPQYKSEAELLGDFDRYYQASWAAPATSAITSTPEELIQVLRHVHSDIQKIRDGQMIAMDVEQMQRNIAHLLERNGSDTLPRVQPSKVATVDSCGFTASWMIEHDLADRWGSLNDYNLSAKPSFQVLKDDPSLLERLQAMQRDELTFVAAKDGQFGVLFEMEYMTFESDGGDFDSHGQELPTEAQRVDQLLKALPGFIEQFPTVEFCLPEPRSMCEGRAGLWGFVAEGALDSDGLDRLMNAFFDHAYPQASKAAA
ncbi:MAG: hypothetical protein A2580_09215 [Hydrogenophilales bacterium RIFOXYD1_FULL_62_11]|nr:MAG: hypothetical protein A2580_09215 [Hydrogenophilales bacterium RIFOXYD1_FULL_62_11]